MNVEGLLARLSVARECGQLPPGLADDLHSALCMALPAAERRELQADCLRQAAALLDGTPWQRAGQLAAIIGRWSGRHGADPIKAALYRAAQLGRLPESARQIYRIIGGD